MTPKADASKRVIAAADAFLAEEAKLEAMNDEDRAREERLAAANACTVRSSEVEAEAEAAVPRESTRPAVPEALRKKWAAQIKRAQRGRTTDWKP